MTTTPKGGRFATTTVTSARRKRKKPLPREMVNHLARIGNLLGDSVSLPDLQAQVPALLTALAKAASIGRDGAGPLKPAERAELALVPDFPLPPVTVGGQSFPLVASIDWEFRQGGALLKPPSDFAPVNLAAEAVSILFKPLVTELPAKAGDVRTVSVQVRLKLKLIVPGVLVGQTGTVTFVSEEIVLPQPSQGLVELPVLPIEVPTFVALFRHRFFKAESSGLRGFVVLMWNRSTPLDNEADILRRLGTLGAQAAPLLDAFVQLPSGLGEIAQVVKLLDAQRPLIRAVPATNGEIARLNAIGMPNDDSALDAGNAVSSLIFVGVATTSGKPVLECFNETEHKQNGAWFQLRTGTAGVVLVPDLHSDAPATQPSGLLRVKKKPGVANTFGDGLSSVRIRREPI